MDRFPSELLYILVFAGIVLFNAVQAMRRRQRQAEEAAAPPEPPPAADEPLEDIWGRRAAPAPVPAPAMAERPAPDVPAEPAAPRRMHPVRALLREPRDLRRAVVLTMVLGPCRALEPPER